MSTQTLSVEIEAQIGRFGSNLDKALSKLDDFGQKVERAGQTLSLSLSAPLGFLAKQMSDAFAESDSMARGLATLEKNAGTLQTRLDKLNDIAKLPGLGFDEAVAGDIRLRTVFERIYGIEGAAKQSERSLLQLGNAVALVGKGKSEFDRALYSLQQMANTKLPLGEDLGIIVDAIPQISPLLNEAFGSSRADDLRKMGITSQQIIETILTGLEKLPRASGGWKNAIENMQNSISQSMSKVFGSINSVLNLSGVMDGFSNTIESLAQRFASLSPMTQKAIAVIGGLAIVIPPILAGLGALATTVIPAVVAGFSALISPIGLVVVAVGAAVAAIVLNWDKVKKALVDSGVWDTLKSIIKSALGVIVSIFGTFKNLFTGDWEKMLSHFTNIFKYAWNLILSLAGAGAKALNNVMAKAFETVGLDRMSKSAAEFGGQIDAIIKKLAYDVPAVTGNVSNLFEGFNFGGDRTVKTGTSNAGASGDKKKAKTFSEQLEEQLKGVERAIKDFQARYPGVEVPLFLRVRKGEIQDKLKIDEKTDLPSAKDIGPAKSAAERYWQALSKGWYTPMQRAFEARKNDVARAVGDIQSSILQSVESVASQLTGSIPIKEIENRLAKMLAGTKDAVEKYKQLMAELSEKTDKEKDATLTSWEEMGEAISTALSSGLANAANSMGELVGNLFSGAAKVNDLPKMILGVIADMAVQLGKLAIGIGLAAKGIKIAFTSLGWAGALAAGVALVALGTAAKAGAASIGKSVPALANGGAAYGPTLAMIGDNPRASVDPEVVAPLSKLQKMIGNGGGAQPIVVGGTLRASLGELYIELEQEGLKRKDTYGRG